MTRPLKMLSAVLLFPVALAAQYSFNTTYDVALFGDMPYGTDREPMYERLIADVNAYHPLFGAHIGDTKSGSTRCDDAQAAKTFNYFSRFQIPVIYSVGDNEWTDCMRTNNGAFDPLGRLALIRRTFFST